MWWCRMKSMQTRVTSPQKTTAASSSEALGCSCFKMSACCVQSVQWRWKLLAKRLQHVSKMPPVDDSFQILHDLSRIQDNDPNMYMNPTKGLQPPPLQFWAVPEAEWAQSHFDNSVHFVSSVLMTLNYTLFQENNQTSIDHSSEKSTPGSSVEHIEPLGWCSCRLSAFSYNQKQPCLQRMLMQWCRMKSMQTRVTGPQKTTAASSSEALGCSCFKMSACRIHSIQWHWKLLAKRLQHVSKMSPVDDSFQILHDLSRIQDNDQNMYMNPTKGLQPPPLQFWAVPEAEWAQSHFDNSVHFVSSVLMTLNYTLFQENNQTSIDHSSEKSTPGSSVEHIEPLGWCSCRLSAFSYNQKQPCLQRMLMQWCRMKSMQTRVTGPQKTTAASSSEALGCSCFKMSACRIHSIQWHWKLLAKRLQHVSKMSPVDDSFQILHDLSRIQDNDQNMYMNPTKGLQPPPLQFWAVPEAEWAQSHFDNSVHFVSSVLMTLNYTLFLENNQTSIDHSSEKATPGPSVEHIEPLGWCSCRLSAFSYNKNNFVSRECRCGDVAWRACKPGWQAPRKQP